MLILMLFMVTMTMFAQRTIVKTTDLQKTITDKISKDYPGYVITQSDKVIANNVTTFEVAIKKGNTSETLVFDREGKFMNKLVAKSGMTGKPASVSHIAHKKTGSKSKAGK